MLLFFFLWGAIGKIPRKVSGEGILANGAGSVIIYAPTDGTISDISIQQNMKIDCNDTLVRIKTAQGDIIPVHASHQGRIGGLEVMLEQHVKAGDALGRILVQSDNADLLSVVCYFPLAEANRIIPGMEMEVYPRGVNTNDTGHMRALVSSASRYPSTKSDIVYEVGNEAIADSLLKNAPLIVVRGVLLKDANSLNSYQWSNRNGGEVKISDGMLLHATVIVGYDSPYVLALPFLKKMLSGGTA